MSELRCLAGSDIWATNSHERKVRSKGHFFYPWKDKDRCKRRFERRTSSGSIMLSKGSGCKRAQPRLSAILPLGGLVHAEVVVFVRQG